MLSARAPDDSDAAQDLDTVAIDMDSDIIGCIDSFDDGIVSGWAACRGRHEPISVEVSLGSRSLGVACARLFREDLLAAGIGAGRHGFTFHVPDDVRTLPEYSLDVCEVVAGTPLQRSPFHVREDAGRPFAGGAQQLRRFVASQYFSGQGLEIGALHRPMPLPPTATACYADSFSTDHLISLWSPEVDGHTVVPVDLVVDATRLSGVDDRAFDFVIASHVLEHLEDPVRSVLNLVRVVRPGGAVFIAIPDRRRTFDVSRPATPIEHVMRDYRDGPAWSRREHYDEWVRVVEGLDQDTADSRISKLEADLYPIHFHVWQPMEFIELLSSVRVLSDVPFEVDFFKAHAAEGLWVLKSGR